MKSSTSPIIQERTLPSLVLRKVDSLLARRRQTPAPPERTIGVGLIGLGNVANWLYLPRLRNPASGFRLQAVYDVRTELCQEVAGASGARAARSIPELIDASGVEAVLICTPTDFHQEAVLAALRARKHVLCEKPLGRSTAEAVAMHQASLAARTVNMVNFSYRFRNDLHFAGEIVASGELGTVHQLWGSLSQGQWFDERCLPANQRSDAAKWKFGENGGVLLDLGPHLLDLCRWWGGEITEISAWTESLGNALPRAEAACGLSLAFKSGGHAQLLTSRLATGSREQTFLELTGTHGALRVDPSGLQLWTRGTPRWRRLLIPTARLDFLRSFHDAISGNSGRIPTFADGLHNNQLIDAAYRSAQEGKRVRLEDEPLIGKDVSS